MAIKERIKWLENKLGMQKPEAKYRPTYCDLIKWALSRDKGIIPGNVDWDYVHEIIPKLFPKLADRTSEKKGEENGG